MKSAVLSWHIYTTEQEWKMHTLGQHTLFTIVFPLFTCCGSISLSLLTVGDMILIRKNKCRDSCWCMSQSVDGAAECELPTGVWTVCTVCVFVKVGEQIGVIRFGGEVSIKHFYIHLFFYYGPISLCLSHPVLATVILMLFCTICS